MGVFNTIRGIVGGAGSVLTMIVLAVADHLWGENVFNCPCGDHRILYTSAFLVVPPVFIILMDISWRSLCVTCRQDCCCQCSDDCRGQSCGCCCDCGQCCRADSTCCHFQTCETVVRLTARPIVIAIIWLVFSFMEPKFGRCIFKQVPCDCTEQDLALNRDCSPENKEKAALLRVIVAGFVLGLTAFVLVLGVLYLFCRCCIPCTLNCCRRICCTNCVDCIRTRCETWMESEEPEKQKGLRRSLYALRLEPVTVLKLQEEGLMYERLLLRLSDQAVHRLSNSISIGQMEILRVHRQDIRMVRWLLDEHFSKKDVRKVLDLAETLGGTINAVRDSLNSEDKVSDDVARALHAALGAHGVAANPAPALAPAPAPAPAPGPASGTVSKKSQGESQTAETRA